MADQVCEVAIVGGGVAGLTAAYELRDRDVVVLEAEETVGGRSRRGVLGGQRITIGGEGWYDPNPASYERHLLSQLGIPLNEPAGGSAALIWSERLIRLGPLSELLEELPLSQVAKADFARAYQRIHETTEILAEPSRSWELAKELVKKNGAEWLGSLHPEALDLFRQLLSSEYSVLPEETTAFQLVWGLPPFAGASSYWQKFLVPEGGGPSIAEALAARLQRPPETGCVVTSVVDDGGCVVRYSRHSEKRSLRARKVVMATPAAPLPRLVRGLPSWKAGALAWVRSDPIIAMYLLIHDGGSMPWDDLKVTWALDTSFSMALPSKTDFAERTQGDVRDKRSIMHLFAVGAAAKPHLDSPETAVCELLEGDFLRVFPEAEGKIAGRHLRKWHEGTVVPRFGYEVYVPDLMKPVGNLHFAGAHLGFVSEDVCGGFGQRGDMGEYHITGGLHAAMRSGVRVAREIAKAK